MTLLLVACLLAVFYTQVGYTCVMWLLARFFPRRPDAALPLPEAVTIVLCVHNGEKEIEQRLRNLAACQWEGGREILVFCDGCEDDTAARAELCRLPGVGEKVANCALLFGFERVRAFPIDVWIERVLRERYFKRKRKVTSPRLRAFAAEYFGPYGGYAQQYLFHHARMTWRGRGKG